LGVANPDPNRKKLRSSTKIALAGIIASLSVLFMFLTGVFPFAEYALPAMAGLILVILVVEIDFKTAVIAYVATSIIIVLTAPSKVSAIYYVFFFGHYGIVKFKLELIRFKIPRLVVKFLYFNACIIAGFWVMVATMGMEQVMESFGDFGKYSLLIFLVIVNIIFVVYDYCITNFIKAYQLVFRPKYLRFLK